MGKVSKQKPVETKAVQDVKAKEVASSESVKDLAAEHLPPLGLVFTVIACSGILFMFSFRDVFGTGRNIAGGMDEAYLVSHVNCGAVTSQSARIFVCDFLLLTNSNSNIRNQSHFSATRTAGNPHKEV